MTFESRRVFTRLSICASLAILLFAVTMTLPGRRVQSAFFAVPTGFTDTLFVGGLSNATAMDFAPDGRLFVCQQSGELRVIKNGALLTSPFAILPVHFTGERGLLGVAFDPAFATNQYVYVYYTVPGSPAHNRVSRLTASGDLVVEDSEVVLLELDDLSAQTNHNGGAIHFGPDNHLYIAVGDNANATNAQALTTLHGKMLRIQSDGGIPDNNPFDSQTAGNRKAIWARGLRNPFTFSFQPGTGRMFINDVGEGTREEVNDGIAGSNYGWNNCEGPCNPPNANFRDPVYNYLNDSSTCAITGGVFYNPAAVQFPAEYVGKYFLADFCGQWIRRIDPANLAAGATDFATSISSAVDLKVDSLGSVYYLARGAGSVRRISYPANMVAPTIDPAPASQSILVGGSATFNVGITGGASPYTYQWQRNNSNITGATQSSYMLSNAQLSDSGATFRVLVTNAFGTSTSNAATLTVSQECTYALSPAVRNFSAKVGASSATLTTSPGCPWSVSNALSWVQITSSTSGSGTTTTTFNVQVNPGVRRTGVITIGGQPLTIQQGANFSDVAQNDIFYELIGKVSAAGITLGCDQVGLQFCSDSAVTREQMAAFVIRALGMPNPPQPANQRFSDVPPSHPFYAHIDQMAVLGITLGCDPQGLIYCPASSVTREQMAAFIMRALGEPNPPTPQTQRFGDVPPSHIFYAHIDRMAVLQITLGCHTEPDPPIYCPSSAVTRGQMAAFLARAFQL